MRFNLAAVMHTNSKSGEVKSRAYPAPEHTYPMPAESLTEFENIIKSQTF